MGSHSQITDHTSDDMTATKHLEPHGGGEALELPPGATVGRYVIVERVASGGMGTVYHAYDPRLNRRVALKVLREGAIAAEASGEQRLVREAQSLAQLSSPNVVQVYEVSTAEIEERGELLYIAMEYADGQTLSEWWRDTTRSWREVVEVLLLAGRGLVDAHAVGLVHRDFKPANVLVSEDGRVRVVDFGLAKVSPDRAPSGASNSAGHRISRDSDPDFIPHSTETTPLTEVGQVMGTPAYMAPEQHLGDAGDERSDIYSFCLTLFEGLYGARPFRGSSHKELLARKRALKVRSISDRGVPKRLRKIIMRGLSPTVEDRWPSVPALLEALERALNWRKRMATGGVVGSLVVAAGASVWVTAAADPCDEAAEAVDSEWSSERSNALAQAFEGTGTATGAATWERIEPRLAKFADSWREGRQQACVDHQRGAQSAELFDRRAACLDEALRGLSGLLEILDDADAEVVFNADRAVGTLPDLGRCADPEVLLAEVALPRDSEVAKEVAVLRGAMAADRARLEAGRYEAALGSAVELAAEAARIDYAPVQAEALLLLGRAQARMGMDRQSAESMDDAFRVALASGHDRIALSAAQPLILIIGHRLGQPEAALARRTVVEALLERLSAPAADRARAKEAIASALREARRLDEADTLMQEAIAIRREHADEDPHGLANALNNYGNLLRDNERYADSIASFEESIEILTALLGDSHPSLASTLANLVAVKIDQGRGAETVEIAERVWTIYRATLGPEHAETAEALSQLGAVRWLAGERDRALEDLSQSVASLEKILGDEHGATISALSNYGALLIYRDRLEDARPPLLRALAGAEADPNRRSGDVGFIASMLGRLEAEAGNPDKARAYYAKTLRHYEEIAGPDSSQMMTPLENLALLENAEGNHELALEHLRRAIELAEGKAIARRDIADLYADMGEILYEQQRWAESAQALRDAERNYVDGKAAGDTSPAGAERLAEVRKRLDEVQPKLEG